MKRRDRLRIVQVALIVTLSVWGLFTGISAGSKYQEETDWPFSEVAMLALGIMIAISLLLTITPRTRGMAKAVGVSAAAFTLALLLGHLVGNRGPGGPEVPRSGGGRGVR
jgi:hypothetical protein